jgi:hypothetical protein
MLIREGATGSAFKVFFETLSLLDALEGDVHLQFPGQKLRSVRALARIMICHALPKVGCMTDVPLANLAQALKNVGVEHDGLPAVAWNPRQCQASHRQLRIRGLGFQAKAGVPSRNLTSNLEFRTLPLCTLSYGDGKVF